MYQGVHIFFQLRSFGGVGGWVSFHPNIVRLEKNVRKNGRPLSLILFLMILLDEHVYAGQIELRCSLGALFHEVLLITTHYKHCIQFY